MSFLIRQAEKSDVQTILEFIKGLAEYEHLSHEVVATEELLTDALFSENKVVYCKLAFEGDTPIGFALYFYNFSTFLGRKGIYLEDLFVDPDHRGKGYGKALLVSLAKQAVEEDCGRVEWSVLDWNEPSINFYKSLGALPMDEWTVFRLTGEALKNLGA
ncbi:MAG: GNAT family N-acetyltransferase [Bacteroidota bacterium]